MQNAPFDHSEQMEPFTRNELPEVYTLYQQAFDLKTSYNDFVHRKTQLLKIVEDPLSLRLVAITYAGQAIPDTLKASKVVEQYIQMMVDSAILREESIDLLSENILPLMLRPPQYRNHLIREDIDAADTESRRLRQAIYEDSGGRLHFSTAFRMLIDSELLAYQETDSYINLNISFRYERFYDYFVGKAMLRWAQSATEQKKFFEEKICQTKNTDTGGYLLWGGIRNALMWYTQRKEHTIDIQPLLSLCFTEQQRVKEMMSSVLTELGQENEVDSVLREIISEPEQNNRPQRLHRLIPVDAWAKAAVQPLWMRMPMKNVEAIAQTQQQREQERKNKNAQKIAIEVAANLNRAWVLLSAARQADPQIRAIAVYHIYRLWLREPHIGFAIMQRLAEDAAPDIIPDIPLLEAVTHLSLIVFFNHAKKAFVEQQTRYRNQDQVDNNNSSVIGYQQQNYVSNSRINASQVQNIWRGILARVLGLHEEQRKYARLFREMLREGLFRSLIGVVFRFTEESWLKHYSSLYADFDGFFRLSKTEKELYYRLVQYLNLEGDYSREQMEQDFIAAFSINNRLVWFVFLLAITTHGISYQHDFLPTLKRLFDESYRYSVPNTYLLAVNSALASMLNHNPDEDEVYDYLIDTIEVCQDYCAEYAHLPELKLSFQDPRAYGLGPYIHNTYRRKGTARSDWLISRVNAALDEHNIAFFEFLLGTELPVRRPHIALDTLPLFFNKGNQAVDTLVQLYLARLHVFYPDAVDRFLEEQNAPEAMRNEISRIEPVETIGDLVGMQAWFYLRDDMILYSPAQRQWIMRIFLQAVECRNVREWLDYFLREIINTIYGETIFTRRQKRDES
jgi:hypothetical protein